MAEQNKADDAQRRLRGRNLALALAIGGLVVLFYLVSMVRMGEQL